MTTLNERERAFLRESDALEGIVDERVDVDATGHAAAYLDAREQALQRGPLAVDDLCRWQQGVAEAPVHGRSGDAQDRLHALVAEVNARIAKIGDMPEDVPLAEALGELLQRFHAIDPSVGGNGRTGRLLLAYLAIRLHLPVIIVRAAERPAFQAALRSRLGMCVFMADKLREAIEWPGRGWLERQASGAFADMYDGLTVDRHELVQKQDEWRAADEASQAR